MPPEKHPLARFIDDPDVFKGADAMREADLKVLRDAGVKDVSFREFLGSIDDPNTDGKEHD